MFTGTTDRRIAALLNSRTFRRMADEETAEVEMEMQGEREKLAQRRGELTRELDGLYEQRAAAFKAKKAIVDKAVAECQRAWEELKQVNRIPARARALEGERARIERQLLEMAPQALADFIERMNTLTQTIRKNGYPSKTVKLPADQWNDARSETVVDLEAIPAAFKAIDEARNAAEALVLEAPSIGDLPELLASLEPDLPKSIAAML